MKANLIVLLFLLSNVGIIVLIALTITLLLTRVLPKLGAKSQARLRHWREVAKDLGLEYSDALGHGSMRGMLHGMDVEFREHADYGDDTGPQHHNPTGRCWSFRARLPAALPADLSITLVRAHAFLLKGIKLFGPRQAEVDDPAFDETFFIKAHDVHEARAYLTPAHRREALMELSGLDALGCGISSGHLHVMLKSPPIDAELEPAIQRFLDITHHHIHGRQRPPSA